MNEENSNKENTSNRSETILTDDFCNSLKIGDKAPLFSANTTYGKINLNDYKGKWLILFSHPGDFTPVCTTEFLSFAKMYPEFKKRNCELLGLSIDSTPSHLAWVNNILKTTGIQIPFPIIADRDMQIAKKYGMIAPNASNTQTIRSVFFICPEQTIRAKLEYPMTNGRNIGEILRLLDAMQITDSQNVVTPANWLPEQPTIFPSPKTYQELMENKNNINGFNCIDWYLCFNISDNINNIPNYSNKIEPDTLNKTYINKECLDSKDNLNISNEC